MAPCRSICGAPQCEDDELSADRASARDSIEEDLSVGGLFIV